MTGIQVVIASLETTKASLETFISDFTDAELLVRPVPEANHAAWQIGNVILGDPFLITAELPDAVYPEISATFTELHSSKGTKIDKAEGFLTKAGYLKLFSEVRAATIAAAANLTDADLDRPTSDKMKWTGPTLAHVFLFAANHTLMHAGQFSFIRRKLGKPVLF